MIKYIIYAIITAAIIVLGLAVGSANDAQVSFDFLFVKTSLSLAQVLMIGTGIGVILGLWMSGLFCLKMWKRFLQAKLEASRLRKQAKQA